MDCRIVRKWQKYYFVPSTPKRSIIAREEGRVAKKEKEPFHSTLGPIPSGTNNREGNRYPRQELAFPLTPVSLRRAKIFSKGSFPMCLFELTRVLHSPTHPQDSRNGQISHRKHRRLSHQLYRHHWEPKKGFFRGADLRMSSRLQPLASLISLFLISR